MDTGVKHLTLQGVEVPVYKFRGEDAQLECQYDRGTDPLYSVKWYKDDNEFYRSVCGVKRFYATGTGVGGRGVRLCGEGALFLINLLKCFAILVVIWMGVYESRSANFLILYCFLLRDNNLRRALRSDLGDNSSVKTIYGFNFDLLRSWLTDKLNRTPTECVNYCGINDILCESPTENILDNLAR